MTPHCLPPYHPESQAAAEEERARKKAEEDQAKEKVCLGTNPDVPRPLHPDLACETGRDPQSGLGGDGAVSIGGGTQGCHGLWDRDLA